MTNPFELILEKLDAIQHELTALKAVPTKSMASEPQEALLTEEELLDMLKICRSTSIKYRSQGMPYVRKDGRLFYFRSEVYEWLKSARKTY